MGSPEAPCLSVEGASGRDGAGDRLKSISMGSRVLRRESSSMGSQVLADTAGGDK